MYIIYDTLVRVRNRVLDYYKSSGWEERDLLLGRDKRFSVDITDVSGIMSCGIMEDTTYFVLETYMLLDLVRVGDKEWEKLSQDKYMIKLKTKKGEFTLSEMGKTFKKEDYEDVWFEALMIG